MRNSQKGPETTASFASPNIHPWLYVYNFFSPSHKQLSKSFLNAFALDYCDLKIKEFYSYLQHYGTNQAIRRNRSNFQVLLECIHLKMLLHHIDLLYKLRCLFGTFKMIWPVAPNLAFCP